MELIINRVKYHFEEELASKILVSKTELGGFRMKYNFFLEKFTEQENIEKLEKWKEEKVIQENDDIYYSLDTDPTDEICELNYENKFKYHALLTNLADGLKKQGLYIELKPTGCDLSAYEKIKAYNDNWNVFRRVDFKFNTWFNELTLNIGSNSTLVSNSAISVDNTFGNVKYLATNNMIRRCDSESGIECNLIANNIVKNHFRLDITSLPINYKERYQNLTSFYNEKLKSSQFGALKFVSPSFIGVPTKKVRFEKNKMVFKNHQLDINPITGMKNFGVYKSVPNSFEKKIIFIYQNRNDANNLFKYLKGGFKQFPGLERYVGIPVVLANSEAGDGYKRLQYQGKEDLLRAYKEFETNELPNDSYENYVAIVIGDFDKNNPDSEYYALKYMLLNKGIASQFVKEENIRKTSVFNYHLPNIAIGIHAKLGGIPWRLDSDKKNDLVIGFNQVKVGDDRYIGSSVFFDNEGYLKRTTAYRDSNDSKDLITQLKESVNEYISENSGIDRLVIHYYKTFSGKEKERIDKLLKREFNIPIPYALVEVNDSKSKLELAFDPNYDFGMPISGTFLNLTKQEYLLFNNNRFSDKSGVILKDELPLKLKIHFADQSGFSHKELIEQVYEFSRLIWKGLKQRIQPATCYYAKQIANFYANSEEGVPNNNLTQHTPWFL